MTKTVGWFGAAVVAVLLLAGAARAADLPLAAASPLTGVSRQPSRVQPTQFFG